MTDATERDAPPDGMDDSAAQYRALVENIPQRVFHKDLQSRYVAVNNRYAEDMGVTPEDMVGKDDFAFHPRELAERYRRDDQRIMASGRVEEFDESYFRNGRECVIHTTKTPVRDAHGRTIGVCGIFQDVTEQRRMEERMRDSEATLRAIYDHVREGILVADAQSRRFIMANPAICRMLGYSEAELVTMTPEDLHLPETLPRVRAHFQAMERGEFDPQGDIPFQRKDGAILHLDVHAIQVAIRGRPCFLGVFRDLTEATRARAALLRSEETYARAETIAHIGSWDWDIPTGGLRWTDEIYRIFGQTPQSFDATYPAFLEAIHPEDRQRVIDAVNASVADPAVPYDVEHRVTRPDGEIRHVHERGVVYRDESGAPLRMIGTVHDISERKAAEAELTRHREHLEELVQARTAEVEKASRRNAIIVDAAMDGFFSAGLDGRVNDCNEAYCRMLGYTREEMLGLRTADLEADESPEEMAAHIRRITEQGRDRFDTRHRRKDGGLVHVEVNLSLEALGGERHFFAFVHDITERKQHETALTQAKEEAERANRAKSDFLSRMSHELRTPLNAILGFAQLLESDPLHPLAAEQHDNVREILHGGRHLLEMINEILDLARIESGMLSVSLEEVAMEPVLEECRALASPLAEARGIRLNVQATAARKGARADRTRLKQVLINLLSNAVKYNREGGRITMACHGHGNRVRLTVTDTGPGLSPEQQARLFQPFERLGADKAAIEGTGIGLALSRRLMELMQGEIGVDSTPGQGTTFWLELPAAQAEVRDGPLPAKASAAEAEDASAAGRPTILYVDDNPANIRLMERILGMRKGLRLLTADRPSLGMDLAAAHRPALILLDINPPEMDGYAILPQLRASPRTRDIPVVGISANAMPRDMERARAAGFSAYLTKPLEVGKLLAVVDGILPSRGSPLEGDA